MSTSESSLPKRLARSISAVSAASKARRFDSPVSSSVTERRAVVSCSSTFSIERATWPAR